LSNAVRRTTTTWLSTSTGGWRNYLKQVVRLGFVYLAVVAVVAAIVAVGSWGSAVIAAWLVPAFALFAACLYVGPKGGVSGETASVAGGLLVALIATAAFAFLGLVVAVNIWLMTGRGL